jgi:hypothetical protein
MLAQELCKNIEGDVGEGEALRPAFTDSASICAAERKRSGSFLCNVLFFLPGVGFTH